MDWYFDLAIVFLMGVILLLVSVFTIGDLVQVKKREQKREHGHEQNQNKDSHS